MYGVYIQLEKWFISSVWDILSFIHTFVMYVARFYGQFRPLASSGVINTGLYIAPCCFVLGNILYVTLSHHFIVDWVAIFVLVVLEEWHVFHIILCGFNL